MSFSKAIERAIYFLGAQDWNCIPTKTETETTQPVGLWKYITAQGCEEVPGGLYVYGSSMRVSFLSFKSFEGFYSSE